MKKIVRMTIFILIAFISVSIFFALTLFLLSLIINSNINIYLKTLLMIVSYFLLTKVIYRIFIFGTIIRESTKHMVFPKIYLPLVILLSLSLLIYTFYNYTDLLFSFGNSDLFSLTTIIYGFFILSGFHILSPLFYFYINSIKPRNELSNIEIRYGIYEDLEYLLMKNDVSYSSPIEDSVYWEKELEKEYKSKIDTNKTIWCENCVSYKKVKKWQSNEIYQIDLFESISDIPCQFPTEDFWRKFLKTPKGDRFLYLKNCEKFTKK